MLFGLHWPPTMYSEEPTRVAVWYARGIGPLPRATRGRNHASVSVLSTSGSSGKYSNVPALAPTTPPISKRFFSTSVEVWPPRGVGASPVVRKTDQAPEAIVDERSWREEGRGARRTQSNC